MALAQLGLVVHPRRDIAGPLDSIAAWGSRNGVAIGQVAIPGQARRVAELVEVESCDLLVAVGGDGTTLAALHAAAPASLPVLGVACGSVGVLTSMHADGLVAGLDQVAAGSWIRRPLPGLEVATVADRVGVAINDFAVVRSGIGQVIAAITVDGELYARTAGDGVVVASQLGSSAYTMAAGGPSCRRGLGAWSSRRWPPTAESLPRWSSGRIAGWDWRWSRATEASAASSTVRNRNGGSRPSR